MSEKTLMEITWPIALAIVCWLTSYVSVLLTVLLAIAGLFSAFIYFAKTYNWFSSSW